MISYKLTAAPRKILERIARRSDPLLEIMVTASGGRSYSQVQGLIRAGYIKRVDHPTVKNRTFPADALEITPAGRSALSAGKTP